MYFFVVLGRVRLNRPPVPFPRKNGFFFESWFLPQLWPLGQLRYCDGWSSGVCPSVCEQPLHVSTPKELWGLYRVCRHLRGPLPCIPRTRSLWPILWDIVQLLHVILYGEYIVILIIDQKDLKRQSRSAFWKHLSRPLLAFLPFDLEPFLKVIANRRNMTSSNLRVGLNTLTHFNTGRARGYMSGLWTPYEILTLHS